MLSNTNKESNKNRLKGRINEGVDDNNAIRGDVEDGGIVKVKFGDVWYKGNFSSIEKGKVG